MWRDWRAIVTLRTMMFGAPAYVGLCATCARRVKSLPFLQHALTGRDKRQPPPPNNARTSSHGAIQWGAKLFTGNRFRKWHDGQFLSWGAQLYCAYINWSIHLKRLRLGANIDLLLHTVQLNLVHSAVSMYFGSTIESMMPKINLCVKQTKLCESHLLQNNSRRIMTLFHHHM